MKKVIFLMVGLFYAFASMAQQNILNESVSVRFPEGSAKLTKEKAANFVSEKFHNDKFELNVVQRQHFMGMLVSSPDVLSQISRLHL